MTQLNFCLNTDECSILSGRCLIVAVWKFCVVAWCQWSQTWLRLTTMLASWIFSAERIFGDFQSMTAPGCGDHRKTESLRWQWLFVTSRKQVIMLESLPLCSGCIPSCWAVVMVFRCSESLDYAEKLVCNWYYFVSSQY